jgi:predicted ATPase
VVALRLVRIGPSKAGYGLVEHRTFAEISGNQGGITRAGVRQRQRPAAQTGIVARPGHGNTAWLERHPAFHVAQLPYVELAVLAQRQEPARLLVLGTYRPVETVLRAHPLRGLVQELVGRGQAAEMRLELLPAEDVAAYIAGCLGGPVTTPFATCVYERTEGNALFMVNLVEHLVQQRLVERQAGQWTLREDPAVYGLPMGLRQMLLRRIEALAPEARRVLEAASVVGDTFVVEAVAAGLEATGAEVEAICDALVAQEHFLADTGLRMWPDGTQGGSYQFRHALYQQVLYEQVGATRRAQLHRRIGARLAAGYGTQAGDLAATLALHAERGGETAQAVHYWQQAGEQAAQRHAYHDGVAYLRKGLALLATLPDSPARASDELTLLLILGDLLMIAKGLGAPEAGEVYTRAHTLGQQVGKPQQLFHVLRGLYRFHGTQARLQTAGELSQQLLSLAQHQDDIGLVLEGHMAIGSIALLRGDLVTARMHLEHGLRLCDRQLLPLSSSGGDANRVITLTLLAQTLWGLGYADQSQRQSQEALTLAQQIEYPLSLAYARACAARLSQYRREVTATQDHAEALMTLAAMHGFGHRVEQGRILRGWALAMQDDAPAGVAHIHQGVVALQSLGDKPYHPYQLALLAEAHGQAGQPAVGLTVVDETITLIATSEARWWEPEVYRLQGELLLQFPHPDTSRVIACFHQALTVARAQQARALELRAAMSLSRLWQQQGQHDMARQLLAPIYAWFTEGFDTVDLQAARALLEA